MISEEQIKKYQTIYKEQFGEDISTADALEQGTMLVNLTRVIYKPMTKAELGQVNKQRKETDKEKDNRYAKKEDN